jgi:Na+/proline symporter
MIFIALIASFIVVVHALPSGVSFADAVHLAGATGRLNAVDLRLDFSNRYNVWSGLIGGGFLALAYFGCDQSQVQRYLTGKSIAQSRLSLIFTAIVKIPMQVLILFIGAMVFVLSLFVPSPAIFQPLEAARVAQSSAWKPVEANYERAFQRRRDAAYTAASAIRNRSPETKSAVSKLRETQEAFTRTRQQALEIVEREHGGEKFDDTNYIFLLFVTTYLPLGLVGLVIGVIFSASMGSTSGEINSLATVSVIDIYRRYIVRTGSDRHYLIASRFLTVFWGVYAMSFAAIGARGFGALIVRVNIVGSLFYGGLLGVFVLAFFFKRVQGTAAFCGVLAGEAAIFATAWFTQISFLWYNVIGCVVVVAVALALSTRQTTTGRA